MSNKGFDFVTVAALVATLEEENASFEQAAEAHKASAAVVEERRKRVTDLQMKIDKALEVLKTTPVWGTPWHDAQMNRDKMSATQVRMQQEAMLRQLQQAGNAQLLSNQGMQNAAQNLLNQMAQSGGAAAQNAHAETMRKMAPPPPPLSGGAFKPWE